MTATTRVCYFAYGSNMDGATLRQRRGISWTSARPARLEGWRLAIDKPSFLGTGEAMATLVPEQNAEVWGVLYEIAAGDLDHLELTEGVLIGHYERVEVEVWSLDSTVTRAVTLASSTRDPSIRPTRRYMSLLVSGAREHGLPAEWIATLEAVEAVEESAEHAALRPYFDRAMAKPG